MRGITSRFAAAALALVLGTFGFAADAIDQTRPGLWQPLVIAGKRVVWPRFGNRFVTLRYAFAAGESDGGEGPNCRVMRAPSALLQHSRLAMRQLRSAAAAAFARWASVAPLRFEEIADATAADIIIGEQAEPRGYAFTNISVGPDLEIGLAAISRARICLNPERRWKLGFDGDLTSFDLVHTLTHEIGHAIGLDHPGARGAVMAFRYDESIKNLTDADISGVHELYGRTR